MAKSTWFRAILGAFLSIVIAFVFNAYLKSLRDEVEVVVAAVDIPVQTAITSEMLTVIKVNTSSQKLLVPNALNNPMDLTGAIAMESFKKGDVIVNDVKKVIPGQQTTTDGSKINVSDLGRSFYIPSDKKAISVSLDAEGSLGYSLKKGDKVDVIFTSSSTDSESSYSATILQGVEVFEVEAINEKDRANRTVGQNITMLVSAQAAQDLAFAKRKGKLDLILDSSRVGEVSNKPQKPSNAQKFNP
ncbi:Flp pilus assembly protein CpaB [Paenibacillus oryzisoli]|uniref:Flp pilus assembly protein CpaB n=1 Tax=Paenibacillus oryzisoli TaxID=1850517 RepID=A0A198A4G5_9BACL|nr:Flp pilus assembly protein CpaB [Paenibacillus oryzisoli]OAS16040.1 Flp pilus assembly protein CpaB [Paenibacillus oryzisoli]